MRKLLRERLLACGSIGGKPQKKLKPSYAETTARKTPGMRIHRGLLIVAVHDPLGTGQPPTCVWYVCVCVCVCV